MGAEPTVLADDDEYLSNCIAALLKATHCFSSFVLSVS